VIPKLSRFGRSVKDLVGLFDQFDRDGVALVFLDMNLDTSTSQGRLLRHVMVAFAEYESDVKGDYARANYRHAMKEGRAWGLPPFGYRAENKRYYVVEDEAEIIRTMYRRYVEGATLYQTAFELNAAGMTGRRNGYWRTTQIGRLLANPAYAGLTVLDEHRFEAQWAPILPRDLWEQVQRLRLPENRGQRKRKEGTGGPYLLTGLIACGKCGSNAHHHRKSRGSVYQCMTQQYTKKCAAVECHAIEPTASSPKRCCSGS
jgi:site-specific DNA recombinase